MEVDKENWHPKVSKASKKQSLSRRRSTGIMKGGDSTGALISPKAKKRSRIDMMNKRVSFGVVDVRLYEKDVDWAASPSEKKTARSVDVGSIPFNDGSPISTAPSSDKSMLRTLCDDDDEDDNEEQTMEMTVNHGRIIAQVLSEKTNLSTLLDDDQSEGPGSPLTMDLTMNYSKIMQNNQDNEDMMEMTVNHSKIVGADPVIIKVITSPECSKICDNKYLESAVSPFDAGQKTNQSSKSPSPKEAIAFSISTPPDALKAVAAEIDEFDLISPSRRSFLDNDQTSDLTRNIQDHIGSIVAGDDDDKTMELNRLGSQMTEHEAKVAMEFKRILNSEIEGDATTNIAVHLDNVDDFLSNIQSPEVSSSVAVVRAAKEPPKIELSPVHLPVISSVEAFFAYGKVRFMDASNFTRKTLSIGYALANETVSEAERLHFACFHLPTLANIQDSTDQLSNICSTLSSEIKEMEDWLNSQAPDIFAKYVQIGDERLFENLQQLKQACKLQSKIKWYQHRSRQEESLLATLKQRSQRLFSDKKLITETDSQIRDLMQQQKSYDGKLSILRTAIEDQANRIDEMNNDLEHLRKSESSLSLNLQNLHLAVQKQESLASKKELWLKDEVSLSVKSRELFFLQACFDWRMTKCSETDLVLSFGTLCSITLQISGNGTGSILSAKFVRQKSGSEIWASLIKANEPKFNMILQQLAYVHQIPPLLSKISLWLGRIRSFEMEIQRIMPTYTILVEPSPNDFLLNITICSSSPIASVTFTVNFDVEKFSTNPISLIEIRLLHGPKNLDQDIRDICLSAKGFGSLSKICIEVQTKLSM